MACHKHIYGFTYQQELVAGQLRSQNPYFDIILYQTDRLLSCFCPDFRVI